MHLSRGCRAIGLARERGRIMGLLYSVRATDMGRLHCFANISISMVRGLVSGNMLMVFRGRIFHSPCGAGMGPVRLPIILASRRRATFRNLERG